MATDSTGSTTGSGRISGSGSTVATDSTGSTSVSFLSKVSFISAGIESSAFLSGSEESTALPAAVSSKRPVRFVIFTCTFTLGVIKSLSAASGERSIATPVEGSIDPKTNTLIVTPVAGFVTLTLSPGRYPTVFANNPRGSTPSSATTARPSKDGFDVAKTDAIKIKAIKT